MKRLTVEHIIALHSQLIAVSGGLDGVKDKGLMESSLANIFDTYFGVEKYPTIEEKAAKLCYSLIKNHAFLDGNKRIGILAMLVLLEVNNIILDCSDEDLVFLGLGVVASTLSYKDVLHFIYDH